MWMGLLLAVLGTACADDEGQDEGSCVPGDPMACEEGLVCEEIQGGETACVGPVLLEGRVLDLADGEGIAEATVLGLDANGTPASEVGVTDGEGGFTLLVPTPRDADGAPLSRKVTLRVAASGYLPFPKPPRVALPVDLSAGVPAVGTGPWTVANAATEVGLIALPPGGDRGTVRGVVVHDDAGGTMVVAEAGDAAVATAVCSADGAFVLFNVPFGTIRFTGYRAGLAVTPREITVDKDMLEGVTLEATAEGLARVTGSVTFADAPGGATTSVILVPEALFDPITVGGEAPPGLRVGAVSGPFEIQGVAPGEWVVLAGFENDGLVRDPDEGISGTDVVYLTVPEGEGEVPVPQSFKVTAALAVESPGSTGMEVVDQPAPELVWADDASEDGYELRVYDAFGELVLEVLDVPRETGGKTVSHSWTDPPPEEGMVYQFRVWSYHDTKSSRNYISATEDLLGVFLHLSE